MTLPPGLLRELRAAVARGQPLLAAFDFDGTLAAIRREPSAVRLSAARRLLLSGVDRVPGITILIVSGRSLPFLRRAMTGSRAALAGDHGLELVGLGRRWRHPALVRSMDEARRLALCVRRAVGGIGGVYVEHKAAAIAIHWRRSSIVRRDPEIVRRLLLQLSPKGWRVVPGKMLWELRPDIHWNKGDLIALAARRLKARVLFVGDDATDEEGFRTLGRRAWTVKVGPEKTVARYRLRTLREVDGLLAFLKASRYAMGRRTRERSSMSRAPQR